MSLLPTLELTLEVTNVLIDVEREGLQIDVVALEEIKTAFQEEFDKIVVELEEDVREVMGDTPINLSSGVDRSKVIYSRELVDRDTWIRTHNIGVNPITGKRKRQTEYFPAQFEDILERQTKLVPKTTMEQCPVCRGTGKVAKKLKSGKMGKPRFNCKSCNAKGVLYKSTGKLAGFGVHPRTSKYASANGFNTDKHTLEELSLITKGRAKSFIEKLIRYNALNTYLNTFLEGIEKGLGPDNRIHPSFNQCVTYTGRLSSSNPNFQNMPRGGTFPVKRAIVSRFEGGSILEGDFAQLEFRVAGFLANCDVVRQDVENAEDVHAYTAEVIGCSRQDAKIHTFKPLYGGMSGTDAQKAYYKAFRQKYKGVAKWHVALQDTALTTGIIKLPSGREYDFSNVRRQSWGGVTRITALKNYPVQGFATADLLPIALVRCHAILRGRGMNTVICNTVHDSIILDVYPGEEEMAIEVLKEAMTSLPDETERRYGVRYDMPVGIELKMGPNWLEMEEIYVDNG